MSFEFIEQCSHAEIRHQGQSILNLDKNITYFGGNWWVRNQCMAPGEGPEVSSLPIFGFYNYIVTDIRYEAVPLDDGLKLIITPLKTKHGTAAFQQVMEQCTFTVRLVDGRYEWEQQLDTHILQDLDLAQITSGGPLMVYRFPQQDGHPGYFLQYCDPQPVSASGPAVPMQRDWLEQPEPVVGPEAFRAYWKRRYTAIIFQNPDGSFSWSDLNKTKWYHLTQDNRRARSCHPRGLLYLLKESGEALEYRCAADSHFHHVCEWGMDFHFWLDLEPYMRGTVLPAGTTLTGKTTARLVSPKVTLPIVEEASELKLTLEELAEADLPAYEEPENTFTVSALDRLDAQAWTPTSEGCRWELSGGYRDDSGCLIVSNSYAAEGSWEQRALGPQQWGNPFLAQARYRLSAWVKVENCRCDTSDAGPQVGVEFLQSNGPAPTSTKEIIDCGWSLQLNGTSKPIVDHLDWTYIELITPPCPSNAIYGKLKLRFGGRGTAYFSNVRWEMVDE
ncbi:MAG TPA: hypothetical protein VGM23_09235 [Armatimonadota bacterium]|jgi:hypothetical protein